MSHWHFVVNGKKHGPVTGQRIKQAANRGELMPADLVWFEGWKDWHQAREVEGLIGPDGVIVRDDRDNGMHEPPHPAFHQRGHPAQATLISCPRCGRDHFVDLECPSAFDAAREVATAEAA